MIRMHNSIPDLPQSYDFSPRNIDWFSIIIPEETRNLIKNPIFQRDTSGYSTAPTGVSIERTDEKQRYGSHSLRIDYALPRRIIYQPTISVAGRYTFSTYIFMDTARISPTYPALSNKIQILVEYPLFTVLASTYYEARGYWDRVVISFDAPSAGVYTIAFFGDGGTIAYIDGLQLENKPYATTMCHGDMVGDAYPRKDYWWLGEPHNSYSERSYYCRTGGKEMNFFELGLRTLSIVGIGLAGISNVIVSTTRGGFYTNSVQQDRTFTIVAERHYPQANIGMRERLPIERYMTPFIAAPNQPAMLKYQYYDECGNIDGEELWIKCLYEGGLEGSLDNYQERVGMTFRVYLPYIAKGGSFGMELEPYYSETFTNPHTSSSGMLIRSPDGTWEVSGEFKGQSSNSVYAIESFGDYIYVGGNFGNCNGIANTSQLARYNKSTGVWEAIPGFDALRPGGFVVHLKKGPTNVLYVGGRTGTSYWMVSIDLDDNLTLLASTPGATTFVKAFGVGKDNTLYCSGYESSSYFIYLYDSDTDSWSKVKTSAGSDRYGFNSYVRDIAVGIDGSIYVTGDFTTDDTTTYTYNGIVKSDDSATSGWEMLGISGMSNSTGSSLGNMILLSKSGDLYVVGSFNALDSIPNAAYIAKWNGYSWSALGNGVRAAFGTSGANLHGISEDAAGDIYVTGVLMYAYNLQKYNLLGYEMLKWDGSSWLPYEIDIESSTYPRPLSYGSVIESEYMYMLFTAYQTSEVYSISNNEMHYDADVTDLNAEIVGPGVLLKLGNLTTGEDLSFELEVNAGEVVTLQTGILGLELISSTRGDITHEIFPGSSQSFRLLHGINRPYALYLTTTADSEVVIFADKAFHSLGGAF